MVISMQRWVGKLAVVTGASAGIGAAIAKQLVENGVNVVGIARRKERIEEQAKKLSGEKGKLYAFKADLTKENEIIEAFKWITDNFGAIHILINNAGTVLDNTLIDGDTEKWRYLFNLNTIALCIATREAINNMKSFNINNGHIIHMNSVGGHKVFDLPKLNVYSASKHAITALTETLRFELMRLQSQIKVTSISPGTVATEITTLNPNLPSEWKELLKNNQILYDEDIADAVVYVLSTPEHVQIDELIVKPTGQLF